MQLFPYQQDAIKKIEYDLESARARKIQFRGVCAACVGAGKSFLIAEMARLETEDREGRVLILTHVGELVQQDAEKCEKIIGARPGIFCAGLGGKETGGLVIVASIQSFARDPLAAGEFTLILVDEAHLVNPNGDGQYNKVFAAHPRADIIGFTGTPWRLQSGPIYGDERFFDKVSVTISIAEMQALGRLVPIATKARTLMDAKDLKVIGGEYDTDQQEQTIDPAQVVRALEQHTAERKRVIVFVPGISSGQRLTCALREAGHSAAEVYGHTDRGVRDHAVQEFANGGVKYLVNAGVFTTGYDNPDIDCVVLLRRTMSSALLIQMIGRGLRTSPSAKQDVLVLDYGGNFTIHPHINDIQPPPYTKEKTAVKKPLQRICESCETLNAAGAKVCSACGKPLAAAAPRDLKFGTPGDMATKAQHEGRIQAWKAYAESTKRVKAKPVSAAVMFKSKFGSWPTPAIGTEAGHSFKWGYLDGKRQMQWI